MQKQEHICLEVCSLCRKIHKYPAGAPLAAIYYLAWTKIKNGMFKESHMTENGTFFLCHKMQQ